MKKLRHNSFLQQNGEKFGTDFTPDRKIFNTNIVGTLVRFSTSGCIQYSITRPCNIWPHMLATALKKV